MRHLLLFLLASSPLLAQDPTEVAQDHLGVWRRPRSPFEGIVDQGAKVVDDRAEGTFFAYWVPPEWTAGRVLVAVHGTGGSPYEEIRDEIPLAREFGYLVVAVHWFDGAARSFFGTKKLHPVIARALDHLHAARGADHERVAVCGFSRGGAVSYELAWLDRMGSKRFDLVIAHSGGISLDNRIAPREGGAVDPFLDDLTSGRLGDDALAGTRFFLYSGDRDENWGTGMSEKMAHAQEVIERTSGEVVERVRDPDGGHLGYRQDRRIAERAIGHFLRLTP